VAFPLLNFTVPHQARSLEMLYEDYRRDAARRSILFELDPEAFWQITHRDCHYCGAPAEQVRVKGRRKADCDLSDARHFRYNGIDRIDNDRGYVAGNCVPCCRLCNFAKRDRTYAEWMDWLSRIRAHCPKNSSTRVTLLSTWEAPGRAARAGADR
jgi:hypothetical protein